MFHSKLTLYLLRSLQTPSPLLPLASLSSHLMLHLSMFISCYWIEIGDSSVLTLKFLLHPVRHLSPLLLDNPLVPVPLYPLSSIPWAIFSTCTISSVRRAEQNQAG